jgi:DNA-directed RNA polymerase specialized sigma24 family protein
MIKPTKNNTITHAGRTIYLNNKELLAALEISNKKGKMSDTLAVMLQKLCERYSTRGNFVNYSYREDMVGYAMLMLVRTWKSFDATKGSNPFAFFTQCIKNSFIQYLNQEKRHRDIRDTLISQQGLSPSFNFSDDNDTHFVEDEQDFEYHKEIAANLLKHTQLSDDPIIRDDTGLVVDIVDFEEEISDNSIEIKY